MLFPISHADWQILRTVLRAGTPPLGRELRLVPSRRTKDGTFLDDLVTDGLLVTVGKPDAIVGRPVEPVQFRTRYRLTALGEQAAEYGEYERTFTTEEKPVTGTAAELLDALAARRTWVPPPAPDARRAKGKKG